ncbi:MAG TPA: response regulator transcription factor [Gemmatimonadales bacterium]|nr:response regulator transcription factor [Gemmatimonadales bacterium]
MDLPRGWSPSSRARVVLADDNVLVAAEMQALLEQSFEVVAVVKSGEELETAFEALTPDVIVTDIAMPGEGGLAAVRHIRERSPAARVVLLTVLDSQSMIRLGLLAGASAYVVKADAGDELAQAVKAALEGRRYVSATALQDLR